MDSENSGSFDLKIIDKPLDPNNIPEPIGIGMIQNPKIQSVGERIGYRFGAADAGCGATFIWISFQQKTLQLRFSSCEPDSPLSLDQKDQILATFRFTK